MNPTVSTRYTYGCEHPPEQVDCVDKTPNADGIEDVHCFEWVCSKCQKVLVKREECISASVTIVFDKGWGAKHGYEDKYE